MFARILTRIRGSTYSRLGLAGVLAAVGAFNVAVIARAFGPRRAPVDNGVAVRPEGGGVPVYIAAGPSAERVHWVAPGTRVHLDGTGTFGGSSRFRARIELEEGGSFVGFMEAADLPATEVERVRRAREEAGQGG